MNNPLTLKATEKPVTSQSRMMTFDEANDVRLSALDSLSLSSQILNKTYLAELGHFDVQETTSDLLRSDDVRICQVSRIVLENKQSVLESTAAAYSALGAAGYALFLLLKSDGKETTLYLGTRGQPYQKQGENAMKLLTQVVNGHFSGSQLNQLSYNEVNTVLDELDDNLQSITAVSGVPSLSLEQREHFMQGIEHFIDAAEGKAYQALILAEPIANQQLETIRNSYLQIATNISPLLKQTATFGENESESIAIGISESVAHTVGTSTSIGLSVGGSHSISTSVSESISKTVSLGIKYIIEAGVSVATQAASTMAMANAITAGIAATRTKQESTTTTKTESKTDTTSTGTSRQITMEYQDKNIEQLMKLVDHHLDRVKEARQFGAWNSAAYFLAEDPSMSEALASIFLGLVRGVKSEGEDFALTTWKEKDKTSSVAKWLQQLTHPRLTTPVYNQLNIPFFTPATMVSTKEMAIQLGLPRRSTSAATVIQTEAFGRKVQRANVVNESHHRTVELGNVYHLWNEMVHSPIKLNIDQLTSHVFVSGSTGSGKSNTVYTLLGQLKDDHQIPFMVIEPAKGEYKHVFGNQPGVKVFGTNPKLNELLRINPFKFPDEIHVLEHIDRLIEIFNACWPMYAAMPAVLKEAMLQAYRESGWDLENSCNEFSPAIYPSFKDLLIALEDVIAQSAFSEEVKSNYVGSLVTRVKSLTNGFYGQVFTDREINNQVLFDSNVIIDLSRVGAQETKSLIMGILIMRLSEHRMAYSGMNQPLKHITVLEEAHNILKRTSTEQNSEGANVAGKAVEMLSNAIAEMRTYGEGFIIADQSPSAVDISAIRNTNTKIIMRLPDDADRRLAGKASGVNDKQIEEIAKLAKGVAVVYQNDWLEPVLCKIKHFPTDDNQRFKARIFQEEPFNRKDFDLAVVDFLLHKRISNPKEIKLELIEDGINELELLATVKAPILRALKQYKKTGNVDLWKQHNFSSLAKLTTMFLELKYEVSSLVCKESMKQSKDLSSFSNQLEMIILDKIGGLSKEMLLAVEEALLKEFSLENNINFVFYQQWRNFVRG